MRDKKLQYVLFYIGWLFQTVVEVITPIIFGIMINRIVYYNDLATFLKVGLVFFYVTVFGIILYYMIYEMYGYLWNGINRGLRMEMFGQLQCLSAAEMVSLQQGDTVNMIQYWSMTAVNFVIRNIVHNANNIFRIILCIVIIFRINPVFGAVSVVMVPLSVFAAFRIGSRIRKNSEKNKEKYAKYISWLFEVISSFAKNTMDAQERISIIERMYAFLCKETTDGKDGQYELKERITEISFQNCSFRYGSEQPVVLDSLDFSIRQGEKVAVVGSSGSGKSTLLNLVLGLYQPQEGSILLNGKDLAQYSRASLYDHISVVFQQVLLLKGTIRENLFMGSDGIPEEELVKACKAAGIYDYIRSQEHGFDTVIEQWGKNLSGGQRQRLGLARAYLRASDLVIMDEATASLDRKNEELILENQDAILQGRTCLVVSHRLRTVMQCDRVILLKDGRIQRTGTPEEMKERCPEFRELFVL